MGGSLSDVFILAALWCYTGPLYILGASIALALLFFRRSSSWTHCLRFASSACERQSIHRLRLHAPVRPSDHDEEHVCIGRPFFDEVAGCNAPGERRTWYFCAHGAWVLPVHLSRL